jgi:hypothetical protein
VNEAGHISDLVQILLPLLKDAVYIISNSTLHSVILWPYKEDATLIYLTSESPLFLTLFI